MALNIDILICLALHLAMSSPMSKDSLRYKVKANLPPNIQHFEIVNILCVRDIHSDEIKYKKDLRTTFHLSFTAFNRQFDLALHSNTNQEFYPKLIKINTVIRNQSSSEFFQTDTFVTGKLINEQSVIHGIYIGNSFEGVITTVNDVIYVKGLEHFTNDFDGRVVVYREVDFEQSTPPTFDRPFKWCGVNTSGLTNTSMKGNHFKTVTKRAQKSNTSLLVCGIHLVVDHKFFQGYASRSVAATLFEIMFMMRITNDIYKGTDFDSDTIPDGLVFHLKELTILQVGSNYGFNRKTTFADPVGVLREFSNQAWNGFDDKTAPSPEFCLVVLLTYRTLWDQVVGLAYTKSSSDPLKHGACSVGGSNTVIVTAQMAGNRMSSLTNALTMAHEIGHSFGSPHDTEDQFPELECIPNKPYDVYLMYEYAILATSFPINYKSFSRCSTYYMSPIISYLKTRTDCLKQVDISVCGNTIVEEGEECDCGDEHICEKVDKCCNLPNSKMPCKLDRVTSFCSPQVSPCCSEECLPENPAKVCRPAGECTDTAYCDGVLANCPKPVAKSNKTCLQNTRLCINGSCTESVCTLTGKVECDCLTKDNLCKICCRDQSAKDSVCKPIDNNKVRNKHLYKDFKYKLPGTVCGQGKGFCNKKNQCVPGSYDAFFDDLFQESSQNTFGVNFWYYLVLGVLLLSVVSWGISLFCMERTRLSWETLSIATDEGLTHLTTIDTLLDKLAIKYQQTLAVLEDENRALSIPRMMFLRSLFPETPYELFMAVVKDSYDHGIEVLTVVKTLLDMGEPMMKMETAYRKSSCKHKLIVHWGQENLGSDSEATM